jgi:acyl dehydratase
MALDLNCVGKETAVHELNYDWKTLALYALGIGAKRDELDYLYEGRGPKVYPSFAVVPAYPLLSELLALSQGPYAQVIHGGQTVRVKKAIPAAGLMRSRGKITGLYDLKLLAQMVFETRTEIDGELVFETEWQIFFRGEGGFGGARRPRPPTLNVPKRPPDWIYEEHVSNEQALLYRLSGDHNPLHADPAFAASVGFEQGPILHGLATFGFLCRAVVMQSCGGDASRLHSLTAQFKKPVWPGETLRSEGFTDGNQVLLQMFAQGRDEAVVSSSAAEIGNPL